MVNLRSDICVLGAGSAGLSVAAGAAQMGADTVLIEGGRMGGDCLNFGCVPSKSLLAAGKAAGAHRTAAAMGVHYGEPRVDFAGVHDHVHGVIAGIAPHDSVERFEALGVTVIRDYGRFVSPLEVRTQDYAIRARRFVVATGSRPMVPPIPGLDDVPYLTNETVFDLSECPEHLIVVGAGPIGCELGQAFRHLGARVSLVEMARMLPKDDTELVDILRNRLLGDGLELYEGAGVVAVEKADPGVTVVIERDGAEQRLEGSHLLIAAGRQPNVESLDLEKAYVDYGRGGIQVDARLRSSNKRIFAAGDVTGGLQFTHMAGHHAGIVIRNALFRLPAKVDSRAVPWVTYTSPELAHVGMTETEAREREGEISVLRWPFAENDRAQAERQTDGLVKIVATRRGKILGCTILGAQAGDLVQPWVLAMSQGLKISAMASVIAPYPTRGEAGKRAAGAFYTPKLFSERTKWLVRFLSRFG